MNPYYNRTVYWLYQGYSDTWWGYNIEHSTKLDKIYADFEKRQKIINNQSDDDKSFDIYDDNDNSGDQVDLDLDYTITVNNVIYNIDLDRKIQYNKADPSKQRRIIRIELSDIEPQSRRQTLIDKYQFRGIAGKEEKTD
jgi:hypothetical protein